MGNSGSNTISINLERSNLFYFTGETVSGTVDLNITNKKLEVDEIYITLTGEIGYKRMQTDSYGHPTIIGYANVPFYSAKVIIGQPQSGEKRLILNEGQYSWPFQILLTDYLPPSINNPTSYPHVRYYLQVFVDKSAHKPNTSEERYIIVYPRVNLLQNPQYLLSATFENQSRSEIIFKGTLNKTGYVPGEAIQLTLEIQNRRRFLIQCIDISMLQLYKIGIDTYKNIICQATLPRILNSDDQEIRETLSILIPSKLIPPSYEFQGGNERPTFVSIHYFLKFEVEVGGNFADFEGDIPITLGTEPHPDLNQQQTPNPLMVSYSLNPQQPMWSNDDDLPPSYDSVVQGC
jgi:hypothetical protein